MQASVDALTKFAGDAALKDRIHALCARTLFDQDRDPDTIIARATKLSKALKLPPKRIVQMYLRAPKLMYRTTDSIAANVAGFADLLNQSPHAFLRKAQARILLHSPASMKKRIDDAADRLGLSTSALMQLYRVDPSLLAMRAERVGEAFDVLAQALNVDAASVCRLARRSPPIMWKPPEALAERCATLLALFARFTDRPEAVVVRCPTLLTFDPATLTSTIDELSTITGLERDTCMAMAVKFAPLFYLSPQNIDQKIETLSQGLDMTRQDVVSALTRVPSLAGRKVDGIIRRTKIVHRISLLLGETSTCGDVLLNFPQAPTYGVERLLLRWLVARLGLWQGTVGSLLVMKDHAVKQRLDEHLETLPEHSREADRLARLIKRRFGLGPSDHTDPIVQFPPA